MGEERLDVEVQEASQSGADREEASGCGGDAERRTGSGGCVASPEVSEATFHRWRNQYGGIKSEEARRLKALEEENRRLKQIVADQALDIQMLKHVSSGNWSATPPRDSGRRRGLGVVHRGLFRNIALPCGRFGLSARRRPAHCAAFVQTVRVRLSGAFFGSRERRAPKTPEIREKSQASQSFAFVVQSPQVGPQRRV